MLSTRHRFHGYGSLRRVYANSKNVRGNFVSLRYAHRNSGRPYRVGVIVSKKVHKSAVKRNRIRRRIYEIIRKSEIVTDGTDLIISVYNEQVAEMPATELEALVEQLLQKIA